MFISRHVTQTQNNHNVIYFPDTDVLIIGLIVAENPSKHVIVQVNVPQATFSLSRREQYANSIGSRSRS